jgi:nitric oxide reductase activation protein
MDMPETSPSLFYDRVIEEHYGMVSLLRRYFGLLRPDRIQRFFREERGDDIDFDALIESVVDRHAGITPSDRVYIRREKNLRDVSVAFLVDMSYSTGDVLPSGKRIIDVEREGLVLMAESLESLGDQWAVYGFSTSRRDMVDFYIVRDFDKPFGEAVKMRFESMRPMEQTRLGAVIRHATRLLERRPSRIRLLILLSDGRPYDVDYGDAVYAVEDTRRAIWEGRRQGISFFCITVDKKSRDYLPYMYGESNYILIEDLDALPTMLPLIYKRLTT